MARLFKIQYVLFMIILLLCACGNKSKVSNGSNNNESCIEINNPIDDKYELEKHEEDNGLVWYLSTEKGKKKGIASYRRILNKNKEVIIGPFWGGSADYYANDKRFHIEVLVYDHEPEDGESPVGCHMTVYDVDGNCIIPDSRCYGCAAYEEISSYPHIFWYYVQDSKEKGNGIYGVCDMYGNELIKPGNQVVNYRMVEEYGKEMFVIARKGDQPIYTQIYINEDGEGARYNNSSENEYSADSYTDYENYSNHNDPYQNNSNDSPQPSKFPCRACRNHPGICAGCDGTRQVKQHYNSSTGTWTMRPCNACGGTGNCHACKGDGWIDEGVDF